MTLEIPRKPKRVALLVAVDHYEDEQILSLTCAENDGIELHGFFKHEAGYDEVKLLRKPNSQEVLDTAVSVISSLEEGDTFIFFFAGHGVEHEGRHLLLCPKARYNRLKYMQEVVPVDLLREEANRPGLSRIFILDSCRKNLLRDRDPIGREQGFEGEATLRDIVTKRRAAQPGEGSLAVLCGCAEGQVAQEIAKCGQGLFTAALLAVCKKARQRGVELALSDEFEMAIRREMEELVIKHSLRGGQTPWIQRSGPPPVLFTGQKKEWEIHLDDSGRSQFESTFDKIKLIRQKQLINFVKELKRVRQNEREEEP